MSIPDVPAYAGEREHTEGPRGRRVGLWHVLALGSLTAVGPISTDMYVPALPDLARDLQSSMAMAQATLTVGIVGLALGQLVVGPLSDARGRRMPLIVGGAIFAVVSLLCAVVPSIELLLAMRLLQGLAGAAGMVVALAMARDLYAGAALARCIGMLMAVNSLAPIVAPVLGGQLLRVVSWRGVFVAIGAAGLLLLALACTLGETMPPERRQRGGYRAIGRTLRMLAADRRFVACVLVSSFAFAAGIIIISASPFVLQSVYGLSAQQFSVALGVNALGLAAMAQTSGRLAGRVPPQRLLLWGALGIFAGACWLLVSVLSGIGLLGVLSALFVITGSLGLVAPNALALALADVDPETAGLASAVLGMLQLSVGALAAPLVGLASGASPLPMALAIALCGAATLVVALRAAAGARSPGAV
ncbi:multidrug effflux MFS transporter [Chloroflexia bacterium SDU3-3]|nr:multidrug effflux MFS transporter [Chloroflexia bacterium SDU3-3]